jgi:parvulin-like peptidyl-prolyl isomerase
MARTILQRSITAALPLLALAGCGRSHDDAAVSPAASPAPPTTQAAAQPPAAEAVRPAQPTPVAAHRPAATVNGRPIPADKVYSVYRMNKQALLQRGRVLNDTDDQALKSQSLEAVVADELLYQAAVAQGVTVPSAEIEAAVKQLRARAGSDEAYQKFLADSGFTDADVHEEIGRNMKTAAYGKTLVGGKAVTEEQARKFYDANAPKGMFNVPEQVHVQVILVRATDTDTESVRSDARKRAEEAAKRAAAGEDFAALAKQYSQDKSAARGGELGLVPRGVMFPKFEEIAFSAKPNTVSPVFETPKGFNVIKVLEKHPESTRTYDEVKSALMADMGRVMEQDIIKAKVKELAAAAKITLLDPSFNPPAQAQLTVPSPPAKP